MATTTTTVQFKAPLYGNELPASLTPVTTGNAKTDQKLAHIMGGDVFNKDYIKAAMSLGSDRLLAILDEPALTLGDAYWDDDKVKKLGTGEKRAQRKIYNQASNAINCRLQWLRFLMDEAAKTPKGRTRLIEIMKTASYRPKVRNLAMRSLQEISKTLDNATLKSIATALDATKWDAKREYEINALQHVYAFSIAAALRLDTKAALKKFAPLLDLTKIKKDPDEIRAIAMSYSVNLAIRDGVEPEALAPLTPLLAKMVNNEDLGLNALITLTHLPPDAVTIEPVLKSMGPSADKIGYVNDNAVRIAARVADKDPARVIPYLIAALKKSWQGFDLIFDAFVAVGDPANIPVIEAWLKEKKAWDDPKHQWGIIGRKAIAAIEKKAGGKAAAKKAVAVAAVDIQKVMEKEPPPKKTRPTLAFKKIKKPTKRNIDPIAKQEKDLKALFKEAKLGAQYDALVKPALWLIPTRAPEKSIAIGATKLGGHPDLPPKTPWPRAKGKAKNPLTFLAQIDLASLPKKNALTLPATGLLSFFVNEHLDDGRYLEDCTVIHTTNTNGLVRHDVPDDFFENIYQACSVDFAPMLTTAHSTDWHVTSKLKAGATRDNYADDVYSERDEEHQLLGYRTHQFEESVKKGETLLFQFTSNDEQSDMEFGDADAVCFFIKEDALAKGDFSKVRIQVGD